MNDARVERFRQRVGACETPQLEECAAMVEAYDELTRRHEGMRWLVRETAGDAGRYRAERDAAASRLERVRVLVQEASNE